MGVFRKVTSVSTLGLVDFRPDKERTARYTRQTRSAVRAQSEMQARLAEQQAHAAYQQAAVAQQQMNIAAAQLAAAHNPAPQHSQAALPPGWYVAPNDTPGQLRWWDGVTWTGQVAPVPPPPPQQVP